MLAHVRADGVDALPFCFPDPRMPTLMAMVCRWCRTDMSSQRGTKSAAEGADTAVWLALRSPKDFVTGGFWGERSSISW